MEQHEVHCSARRFIASRDCSIRTMDVDASNLLFQWCRVDLAPASNKSEFINYTNSVR